VEPFSLLFLAVGVYLLFLMFSRTRKQQREVQRTQAGLTPGAEVMTTAGMFATVVELDDQVVVLETAPGQRSRWDRRAVARILPDTTSSSLTSEDGAGDDEAEAETDEGVGARLEHDRASGDLTGPGDAGSSTGTASSGSSDAGPPDRA
jgi:preprotein translocase subunit YajC